MTSATSSKKKTRRGRRSPAIKNYQSALKYIYEQVNFERMRKIRIRPEMFQLDRMRALCEALGDPQDQIRGVHIVGTKGKGSTVAMLSASLQECGYVVGAYTSPHLTDIRERICINNSLISHADFTELTKRVAAAAATLEEKTGPSFFEILTAMAFCHFADQAVDIAIIEAGLGGRLDSTNIMTPVVTAVTSISKDHTHILGHELTAIATEKAGVFKPGVPVVSIKQEPEVEEVFRTHAEEVGTTFEICGKEIDFSARFETSADLGPHTRVCITTDTSRFEHLPCPLQGEHQALNCGLALAILDKLRTRGFEMEDNAVIRGLTKTELAGRMEMVWTDPRVLIDGAHNASAIKALIRGIGAHISYDSLVMIFGCAEDKDVDEMLKCISLGADKIIFVRAKTNPRSLPAEDLQRMFAQISGKMTQTADSVEEAVNLAARAVSREDLICVTGSFFLAGEAKKHLVQKAKKKA
ncbi:MAG: bifunctional folylpolyglutamate synthase/dihydrofolate synthase [Phycisphaerales bacterium JB038]